MTDNEDFPCQNEEYGVECEFPFCSCEADYYDFETDELPELFDRAEYGKIDWPVDVDD